MQSTPDGFGFIIIQGKNRGRARLVKFTGAAALIVTDRVFTIGKGVMLVRASGGEVARTNQLVQVHATVERGDDKKQGYVLRMLHAQSPAGLDVLLAFLQESLGIVTTNPAVAEAVNGAAGPVTYRFDTGNFEMGGVAIQEEREVPAPVYRATPIPRRAQLHPAPRGESLSPRMEQSSQRLPDLEGDPEEFVSMFGMKVKRGQFDRLGDLTFKPGGAGQAVRSAQRESGAPGDAETQKKRKKTGLIKRMARKLGDNSSPQ